MQRILSVIHNSDLMSGIFTIGHAGHLHCESSKELNGIKTHVTVVFFRNDTRAITEITLIRLPPQALRTFLDRIPETEKLRSRL